MWLLVVIATSITGYAQVYLGLRDTRYINVGYAFRSGFSIELEHSVYAEKFKYQHLRGSVAYGRRWGKVAVSVKPYVGLIYTADYYDLGAQVRLDYRPVQRLALTGVINPHYDSALNYKTCFAVGACCKVYRELGIVAQYTTVPEFRESEKRIRAGLSVDLGRLLVQPLLSIPVGGGNNKNVRVAVQMRFGF